MTDLSAAYAPGPWIAASGPHTWLLADLAVDDPRVARCWTAIAAGDADAVLDVLLDGGIAALPDFALIRVDGASTRILARHPVRVTVTVDDEVRTITGAAGRTWSDVDLDGAIGSIHVDAGGAESSLRLPLAQGVVSAGALTISASGIQVAAPAQVPVPGTVEPTPVLETVVDTALEPVPEPEPEPEPEPRGSDYYSRLLGSTVDRDQLLAQLAADDEDGAANAEKTGDEVEATEAPEAASGHTAIWRPETDHPVVEAPVVEPPAPMAPPTSSGGLIDAVPGMGGAPATPPSPAPTAPVIAHFVPTVAQAAPAAETEPTAAAVPVAEAAEIHTVNRAALLKAMNAEAARTGGPTVLAVRCPSKHLTPAYSEHCRVCGDVVVDQDPVDEPRPALGRLVLSSGEVVILDRDVILGRAPESDIEDPALRPSLVRITESGEVSRMHLRVSLDGWQPMIRDLGSANGSTLTLTSSSPQQLRPQEDYVLEPGAEVSLADVVSFRFEVSQ